MKKRSVKVSCLPLVLVVFVQALSPGLASAYSVFTHESIVEYNWSDSILPLLKQRYPGASPKDLDRARGYAYGGALIQDLGYFPGGNRLFSDLTHYVRTGDFVASLLRKSKTIDEYAFALGALEHYVADSIGHPGATNKAVPIYNRGLKEKYGDAMTYEQDPSAHTRAELGFDVVEVVEKRYAFDVYDRFIGFDVAEEVLDAAFKETYGIELKELFILPDLSFASYRYSVCQLMPVITEVAWQAMQKEAVGQDAAQRKPAVREDVVYKYRIPADSKERFKPRGFLVRAISSPLSILHDLGILKIYDPPTDETKKLFRDSYDASNQAYRKRLVDLGQGPPALENVNLDTGRLEEPGDYGMADEACGRLVIMLSKNNFEGVSEQLKSYLLLYYAPGTGNRRMDKGDWKATMSAVGRLRELKVAAD
jgi:hypothetical protein